MANYYSASMLTTSTTTTQYGTMATIKGATNARMEIVLVELWTDDSVAGGVGLAWSTAVSGATITNGGTFVAHDLGDNAATASLVVSTTGTIATNGGVNTVFRRFLHAGAIGNAILWGLPFDGPLKMATGTTAARGELCIVNLKAATPAKYHINVVARDAS